MRSVAFDVGAKRTGVAVSDPTGTLARPCGSISGADAQAALEILAKLKAEADGLGTVVVGLPRRLDGSLTEQSARAHAFGKVLENAGFQVVFQDERLTSVEAEQRLALRERDWRRRKSKLDAASAAVILQDYLDAAGRPGNDDAAPVPL